MLIHDYGEINPRRVFDVATNRLPELIRQLDILIPGEAGEEDAIL